MNVEIVYNPARNVYEILNAEEISSNAVYQYLLGAFHISSLSSLAQKHRDRVQLQSPPTGIELLHTILEAIDRKKSLCFQYRSYYAPSGTIYNYEITPCFVRLFENRWYLIAQYLDKSKVRVLALERMSELHIGERNCVGDPEINATEYYAHCYGIIRDDQAPQIIRTKVYAPQNAYVAALPLHESQKAIEQTEDYTVFEYFMRPSFDLTQELLWHGDKLEVVAPEPYRALLKATIDAMALRY